MNETKQKKKQIYTHTANECERQKGDSFKTIQLYWHITLPWNSILFLLYAVRFLSGAFAPQKNLISLSNITDYGIINIRPMNLNESGEDKSKQLVIQCALQSHIILYQVPDCSLRNYVSSVLFFCCCCAFCEIIFVSCIEAANEKRKKQKPTEPKQPRHI